MPLKIGDRVFAPNKQGNQVLYTGIVTSVSKTGVIVKSDGGKEYFVKPETLEPVREGSARDGSSGKRGELGPKGDKGDKGERGVPGSRGPQGPRGFTGLAGRMGPRGLQGLPGKDGRDGKDGKQGLKGDKGERGKDWDDKRMQRIIARWGGGGGTSTPTKPGGSDTQVQFNDGGVFGGDADLTWNKTTNTLASSVVGGDLNFSTADGANAGTLTFLGGEGGTSSGGSIEMYSGGGNAPGQFIMRSGNGADSGDGGFFTMISGYGSTSGGDGGDYVIRSGGAYLPGYNGGNLIMLAGAGVSGASHGRMRFGHGNNLSLARGDLDFSLLTALRVFTFPDTTGTIGAVVTKTDTGDGTGIEGVFQINTFDNTFKVYADGGWRSLATW